MIEKLLGYYFFHELDHKIREIIVNTIRKQDGGEK